MASAFRSTSIASNDFAASRIHATTEKDSARVGIEHATAMAERRLFGLADTKKVRRARVPHSSGARILGRETSPVPIARDRHP